MTLDQEVMNDETVDVPTVDTAPQPTRASADKRKKESSTSNDHPITKNVSSGVNRRVTLSMIT